MPIEYTVSPEFSLMRARWWGDVEVGEYRDIFEAYLQDRNFLKDGRELCDFSEVTNLDADFSRIWSILTMVNSAVSAGPFSHKSVIFAPNDTLFGLARMYQSLAENAGGIQVWIFREEAEALAHLELPGETISGLDRHGTFLQPSPRVGEMPQAR